MPGYGKALTIQNASLKHVILVEWHVAPNTCALRERKRKRLSGMWLLYTECGRPAWPLSKLGEKHRALQTRYIDLGLGQERARSTALELQGWRSKRQNVLATMRTCSNRGYGS